MNKLEFYSTILGKKSVNNMNYAVENDEVSITYFDFDRKVKEYSEILKEYGIPKNSKVGIQIKDHTCFLTMFLATVYANLIAVPIYINVGEKKLQSIVEDMNISLLISDKKDIDRNDWRLNCFGKDLFISLREKNKNDVDNDIVMIMQTSGTTNKPKGVMLLVNNIISNIMAIDDYLELDKNEKFLIVKNTNHISTIVGEMLVGLYAGATLVFNDNALKINHVADIINKKEITTFFAVPSIMNTILRKNEKFNSSLKTINFYGAKMSKSDIIKLCTTYPEIEFIYSYGQTEASPRVTYIKKDDILKYPGSSGRTIKGVNLTIQDENGKVLGNNKEGEIGVTGPNVMRGYYNDSKLTEKVLRNGELHTGDLGYVNEEGYLYVTGRKDNMIIISGKNIHPEEVEEIIQSYPNVLEVLVKEKQFGNIKGLVCYIVKDQDANIEPREIMKFVKDNAEDYKVPREVIFVKRLEKTLSGKIKRNLDYLEWCTISNIS